MEKGPRDGGFLYPQVDGLEVRDEFLMNFILLSSPRQPENITWATEKVAVGLPWTVWKSNYVDEENSTSQERENLYT